MNRIINSAVSDPLSRLAQEARWFTLSNFLTATRIFLAPCVSLALYYKLWNIACIIFLIAAGTDLLDGFLARLLNDHTHLGRVLDPVADKLFLISSLGSLSFLESPFFKVPIWFFIMVAFRELILLTGGYLVMVITGSCESIKPTIWGKLTTFGQVTFIVWLFVSNRVFKNCIIANYIILVILSALSLFSLFHYVNTVYYSVKNIKK